MFILHNVKFKDILFIDELKIKKGQITCVVGKSSRIYSEE